MAKDNSSNSDDKIAKRQEQARLKKAGGMKARMVEHKNLTLAFYHEQGGDAHDMVTDQATYGACTLSTVEELTGMKKSHIYTTMKFYNTYTAQDVKRLMEHPHVMWSHVVQLLRIEDDKQRAEAEKELFKQPMTRDSFSARVDSMLSKGPATPKKGKGESSDAKPSSIMGKYRKVSKSIGKFLEVSSLAVDAHKEKSKLTGSDSLKKATDEENKLRDDLHATIKQAEAILNVLDDKEQGEK